MSELKSLLKQKSYSELTDEEQVFVSQNISQEDYEAEHQIVVLSEKLKQNQAHLVPNSVIRAELMAKMNASSQQNGSLSMIYRIAASLLFCLGIGLFYFLQKDKTPNSITTIQMGTKIETKENVIENNIILKKDELKAIKKANKKQKIKPVLRVTKDAEEEALALSFNRKNPNLAWQDDDEDTNVEKSTLKCTPN